LISVFTAADSLSRDLCDAQNDCFVRFRHGLRQDIADGRDAERVTDFLQALIE
jgi:hypothetical protein